MDLDHYIWSEKFRPKNIDDVVMDEIYKIKLKRYIIDDKQIPNLLFKGPAGSGKTTCALIICSPNGIISDPESNLLFVAGSDKSTRGIAFVEDVIKAFMRNPPIGNDKIRIVVVDEADNMSDAAYKSLRSIIYGEPLKTCRFIFTCNYPSNIPYPVRSRFVTYQFKQLSREYVLSFCEKILNHEKIKYNVENLKNVINLIYPDIRQIVDILQDNSINGELIIDTKNIKINEKKIITLYKETILSFQQGQKERFNKSMSELVNIITTDDDINYSEIYKSLFEDRSIKAPLKIVISEYCNSHNKALVKYMHFQAMVYKSIQSIRQQMALAKKLQGIKTYS